MAVPATVLSAGTTELFGGSTDTTSNNHRLLRDVRYKWICGYHALSGGVGSIEPVDVRHKAPLDDGDQDAWPRTRR